MQNYKTRIIMASIVVAVAIVTAAGLAAHSRRQAPASTFIPATSRNVTADELKTADGKDGHECLVAVDGVVYKIEGFGLWQNGEHATSQGQAYCGADMTETIGKSPHGRSKLNQLEKIGPLAK